MHFPLHPYAIISILSALITLIASMAAWRRSAPGSLTISLLLLSMTIWSGLYSTRWMNISLDAKISWFHLMYVGVAALPTLFFLFVLEFTHHDAGLTRRNLVLLSFQPIASVLIHWTNGYHHLLYLSLNAIQVNDFMVLEFTRGPWYFINIIYSYTIIGIAFFFLSQAAMHASPLYLNQYRLIFIASALPWLSSIYGELSFIKLSGLDLAPLTFGLSGMIYA